MRLFSTVELVRGLRARGNIVNAGSRNAYDVPDEICQQAANLVEDLERKLALVMEHDSNLIDHLERHAPK